MLNMRGLGFFLVLLAGFVWGFNALVIFLSCLMSKHLWCIMKLLVSLKSPKNCWRKGVVGFFLRFTRNKFLNWFSLFILYIFVVFVCSSLWSCEGWGVNVNRIFYYGTRRLYFLYFATMFWLVKSCLNKDICFCLCSCLWP